MTDIKELKDFSAKIRYFKCIGEDAQGFEQFKYLNLIIGRNNSGKSTLLDLVEHLIRGQFDFKPGQQHAGHPPELIARGPLQEAELKIAFPDNVRGGGIPGNTHWDYGKNFIGIGFEWRISEKPGHRFVTIDDAPKGQTPITRLPNGIKYLQTLADHKLNPFLGKDFRRIHADRNIAPENDSTDLHVSGDGHGVTNIIQHFINKAHLPSALIETTLLNELNAVLKTDAEFTDIVCQQLENNNWEIYLEEQKKGRIPLSQSGSGLKTIILILVNLHLIPAVTGKPLSNFVFGFEELENNLHPALLRRLMSYLYQKATTDQCIFFLTTHSSVEIDLFSKNDDAQIIHVTHDGQYARTKVAKTYVENKGILDDLDVRASDLLQSNGIIWVEGPSDRIYLNRWIALWSNETLIEGNHYQCVFYGGRLLSHLSSEDPDLVKDALSILRVNRNAAILIDSDKTSQQSRINDTKKRIVDEIEAINGIAWVTKGKEIENYIPASAVAKWLNVGQIAQVGQFEKFFEYLEGVKEGEGRHYEGRKPLLAEQLGPRMTKENVSNILDLSARLDEICERIRSWNSM